MVGDGFTPLILTIKTQDNSYAADIPDHYELAQNYPNPFNPTTCIRFGLPEATFVELTIFNSIGQKVRTLLSGYRQAGRFTFSWDGLNDGGEKAQSGVYLYRLETGDFNRTKKMLLIK
ncbi:T9SS type A sorting domain-containing protein [candidate division KSB1 bacterium]|nr:T9SS type A sorting domain-containing protein [candidate division KSB1 bacterium]